MTFSELKTRPLTPFFERWGYTPDPKYSTKKYTCLRLVADKILVNNRPNGLGHYLFWNPKTGQGGSIIDFLLSQNYTFDRIKNEFESIKLPAQPLPPATPLTPKPQIDVHAKWMKYKKLATKSNYLNLERGITLSPQLMYKYAQSAIGTSFGAIFRLCAPLKKEFVGFSIRRGKKDAYNPNSKQVIGSKGLFICGGGTPTHICVCESAVDALSLMQIHYTKGVSVHCTMYISTEGLPSKSQLSNLKFLFQQAKPKKVYLCQDADVQGDHQADLIASSCTPFNFDRKIPKNGLKDWNEVLTS